MADKKKNPLGIEQTRGSFQLAGIVSGVESDRFYSEKDTKNNQPRRTLNFAVTFDKDKKQYVELAGMPTNSVWFSRSETGSDGKRTVETVEVPWKNRNTFDQKGFQMIGVRVGLEREMKSNGNEGNVQKMLTPFDAALYVSQNLKDGMPVFVRGNLEYSTFNDRHFKRFSIQQLSRMRNEPDFEKEDFEATNQFTQRIIFIGIEPSEDKTKFIVSAKIVTYNSVEDAEFVIVNSNFAKIMRKALKPYDLIEVFGHIEIEKNEEDVEVDNGWGVNKMKQRNAPTVVTLVIDGADPESIDHEMYSEKSVDEAIRIANSAKSSKKDYGEDEEDESPWGKKKSNLTVDDDDEDEEW